MDLNGTRIEGRRLNFIQDFHKPRSFKHKANKILFDTKIQTEGIPQGSAVSSKFFILKFNKIAAQLPNDNTFQTSLNMDDIQISYRHPDWRIADRRLQNSIEIVEKIPPEELLQVLRKKTCMLHFMKMSRPLPIELRLSNIEIRTSETVKHLGIVFDSKLDWKDHIQ